jgi:hypothetical protein
MVDNCANPKCGKPLHYLRDGKVFTFSVPRAPAGAGSARLDHTEHYWLCGDCSVSLTLERLPELGIKVLPRYSPASHRPAILGQPDVKRAS